MAKVPATERKTEAKIPQPEASAGLSYRAIPGIADEMLDTAGNVRPVWQTMLAALERMTAHERGEQPPMPASDQPEIMKRAARRRRCAFP